MNNYLLYLTKIVLILCVGTVHPTSLYLKNTPRATWDYVHLAVFEQKPEAAPRLIKMLNTTDVLQINSSTVPFITIEPMSYTSGKKVYAPVTINVKEQTSEHDTLIEVAFFSVQKKDYSGPRPPVTAPQSKYATLKQLVNKGRQLLSHQKKVHFNHSVTVTPLTNEASWEKLRAYEHTQMLLFESNFKQTVDEFRYKNGLPSKIGYYLATVEWPDSAESSSDSSSLSSSSSSS